MLAVDTYVRAVREGTDLGECTVSQIVGEEVANGTDVISIRRLEY